METLRLIIPLSLAVLNQTVGRSGSFASSMGTCKHGAARHLQSPDPIYSINLLARHCEWRRLAY